MAASILVVEDDFALRSALVASLEVSGYSVCIADSAEMALPILSKPKIPNMVITDIQMGALSGIDLLKHIRKSNTALPFILMTAYGDVHDAVEAMRLGACDYLEKPFEPKTLIELIEKYLPTSNEDVVIEDPASIETYQFAERIAQTDSNVLLSGPSGSGKEVMANFIHRTSPRKDQPFVAINCAAIPENMLEATLFGHEKGAFTGAHQSSAGKFEQAQGGTLLLDEITEMPLGLQAKLLRVLQEKEVERLGGKKTIHLDVRIIATTNRNLKEEVKEKRFREDLYYRLNVFPLNCLALKSRPKDILPLADKLLNKYSPVKMKNERAFDAGAKAKLLSYSWPGNVRELDNLVQRVAVLSFDKIIGEKDICFENDVANSGSDFGFANEEKDNEGQLGSDMRNHEFQLILEALVRFEGKKKDVAEHLGISSRTLRYKIAKMRELGFDIPTKKSLA